MEKGKDGLVTIATIASQLLYEIQGPLYYNSDVTASIEDIVLKQIAKNEVHVSGVKGLPPPATTKGKFKFRAHIFEWQQELIVCCSRLYGEGRLAGRIPL